MNKTACLKPKRVILQILSILLILHLRSLGSLAPGSTPFAEWETGLGGGVRAVGVGGSITGFGADLVIIDDPIKSRAEAESKTYRDASGIGSTTIFTRVLSPMPPSSSSRHAGTKTTSPAVW